VVGAPKGKQRGTQFITSSQYALGLLRRAGCSADMGRCFSGKGDQRRPKGASLLCCFDNQLIIDLRYTIDVADRFLGHLFFKETRHVAIQDDSITHAGCADRRRS
jgi:hypothetical protein